MIDSHVLLWWLQPDSDRLSDRAHDFLVQCEAGEGRALLSPATLWELEWKRRTGRLWVATPVRQWVKELECLAWLELPATDAAIWLAAAELDWPHRDSADRIIAATALHFGVPVLTKDARFHAPECPVEAVW